MGIKNNVKKILKEYIDERSSGFKTETFFNPVIYWYVTPHTKERMTDPRNVEPITKQEIKTLCERATPKLYIMLADKRNNFKGGPGFKFRIIDKNNYYLQLGCEIERHETLNEIQVNIKTAIKNGQFLRLQGFVGSNEPSMLTIEI